MDSAGPEQTKSMGAGTILATAVATGLAAANIYYNQPLLAIMGREFPGPVTAVVATSTQVGFAAGLFFLVPLGDVLERRLLIVLQFVALGFALSFEALAPNAASLVLASFLIGVCSSVAQQIVPFAALMAPPERRGAVIGTIMSGLFCGILSSRTIAGLVGAHLGWRAMFWLAVPLSLTGGAMCAAALPRSRSALDMRYTTLLRSLLELWRTLPELRRAGATQALLFGGFSVFWTTLAFQLATPTFGMGAGAAGLFGLVGVVGVLAAPLAGRVADARGPHLTILLGTLLMVVTWTVFAIWISVAGLVVGVIILDFAVQSALVSNQHVIYALRPDARARVNTVFMVTMFLGGAAGSAAAGSAWRAGGWSGVCAVGLGLAMLATAFQATKGR